MANFWLENPEKSEISMADFPARIATGEAEEPPPVRTCSMASPSAGAFSFKELSFSWRAAQGW